MTSMAEPTRIRRSRKASASARPSRAAEGVVRVGDDFGDEYPDADASSTEAVVNLIRVGEALYNEIDRLSQAAFGLPESVLNCLSIIDGAGEPLTPTEIGERALRSSATLTGILDVLERNGWVRRVPNPQDRRSVFVEITDEGKKVADQFCPGVHSLEKAMLAHLDEDERAQLLGLLAKVLTGTARVGADDPMGLEGQRNRPARLQ